MTSGCTQAAIAASAGFLLAVSVASAEESDLRVPPVVVETERSARAGDRVAADVTVLSREDLDQHPGQTLDDVLRHLPGFSLFRRTSSLVAHPTAQGASLRVNGPSGASRALVVVDGVPMNDAFGGWVYWSKLPLESIERIEVLRGSGSVAWGDGALGGVIDVRTRSPREETATLRAELGNRGRRRAELWAGGEHGPVGAALTGRYFDSDGYTPVQSGQRGEIDGRAEIEQQTARGRVDFALSPSARARIDGQLFREDRGNGTDLTRNHTRAFSLRGGAEVDFEDGSNLELYTYAEHQTFESRFSRQAADRSSESPALDQFAVPSDRFGARARWQKTDGRHRWSAGADVEWRRGETREDFRNLGAGFTRRRKAGGEQVLAGIFLEDVFAPAPGWSVVLGGRLDYWRSDEGVRRERDFTTGAQIRDERFDSRSRLLVSPRVAVAREWGDHMSVRATLHQGYRAPTLNELYRPFRVRNDITEANERLDPERAMGAELAWLYADERTRARITAYWNELDDAIANVTLAPGMGATIDPCGFVPNGGSCRQRMNLGRTRNRGFEVELDHHPAPHWSVGASYVFDDAEVTRASPRILEDHAVLQSPRHRFGVEVQYDNPQWFTFSVAVRQVGGQFEDDLGTQRLSGYRVVDAMLSREVRPGFHVFVSGENLFDREYAVGKTADGLVTVGSPALTQLGVRLELP